MKRTLTAAAVGFLVGYGYAFVGALVASKSLGSLRKDPPHPVGPCAADCPRREHPKRHASWEEVKAKADSIRQSKLTVEDMHDVLPTDDELDVPEWLKPWRGDL